MNDDFALYRCDDKAELEKELSQVIAGVETAGMNPDDSPRSKICALGSRTTP